MSKSMDSKNKSIRGLKIFLFFFFTEILIATDTYGISDMLTGYETNVDKPSELPKIKLYSETSPFNKKIPADAKIDLNSSKLIQNLVRQGKRNGFIIALKRFSVTVFFADQNTPQYDVSLTAKWAPAKIMKQVPIPDYAVPDSSSDGQMVIINQTTGCEYDFWRAEKVKGKWSASWGNTTKIDGSGVYEKGYSARGSGFALLAGMIWPDELKSGAIKHALIFTSDPVKRGGPVPPATESDGVSKNKNAIPEGARLQLDPGLDIENLNLTDYEKIIAKALQEYGMFLADSGGGVELEAINPLSVNGNPYDGILPNKRYIDLSRIPLNRFRVIKMGPQIPEPELEIIPTECADMK
mgnify:CR=1 FL=1